MPTLTLMFRGEQLSFTLEKIDRDKLYGYVETETLDTVGKPCERALLVGNGHTLAGKGDTAIAYLSPAGLWRERSKLRAVDVNGAAIIPVKPTFAFPINLDGKETTLDDYLAHSVRLVYQLVSEGDASPADLLAELKEGTILRFPFSYRGGDLADAGFLLLGADGGMYLCVSTPSAIDYATLDARAAPNEEEEAAEEEEELLDFSVL
jgi:hypothetical protein